MAIRPARKTAIPFGTSAGTNQIAKFGSLAAATPVRTNGATADPAVIQALTQWALGWSSAVLAGNSPAIEDMNGFCLVMAYQIVYGMTLGIPEWDSATTYFIGSIVQDGAGNLYVSLQNNNLNNAVSTTAFWRSFSPNKTIVAVNPATGTYASPFSITQAHNGWTFLVNSANGAWQNNLPNPSTLTAGFSFKVKDVGGFLLTNPITFHRFSTELFAGLATDYVASAAYGEWEIITDSTNWFVTGR